MIPQLMTDEVAISSSKFDTTTSGDDFVTDVSKNMGFKGKVDNEEETVPWLLEFSDKDDDDSNSLASSTNEEDNGDNSSNPSWYARNSTALEDPREMRKHLIAESRFGLSLVKGLQEASESKQKKTNDITGKRRERKSVLPGEMWDTIDGQLREVGIELVNREKGGAAEGRTRATLTYYGTSAIFYNHQVRTKIRMRIRYYLSYVRAADGRITDVQREGATKEKGFLELKIKGPRATEENSVDKYRLLLSDAVIADLVNLDAAKNTFLHELEIVKQAVQRECNDDQATLVTTMFQVIGKLAKRKPSFIRPTLVISYERSAFKYVEHDYPIPVVGTAANQKRQRSARKSSKSPSKLRRIKAALPFPRRHGLRKTLPRETATTETSVESDSATRTFEVPRDLEKARLVHSTRSGNNNDDSTADTGHSRNVELHDIEYQFTVDRNVRSHYPLLPVKGETKMPVAEHFIVPNKTELMRYPSDARVVEFKEPLAVATLPEKDRSLDHNSLIRILVDRMEAEIMWGDYDENVGKYGNFRRRLMEEHHPDRIKNELIEIDFSGTGQYAGLESVEESTSRLVEDNLQKQRENQEIDDDGDDNEEYSV